MRNRKQDPLEGMRLALKDAIALEGSTIEEFCWAHDLSKATVSNFLNSKKDFRVSTLGKIAKAIGYDLEIALVKVKIKPH